MNQWLAGLPSPMFYKLTLWSDLENSFVVFRRASLRGIFSAMRAANKFRGLWFIALEVGT